MQMLKHAGFTALAVLWAGCAVDIERTNTPEESAGTIALFRPDSENPCGGGRMPFPTDFIKDSETGLLNIPFCPDDDPTTTSIKQGLRTLNGYSLTTPIYVDFSKPIQVETAADGVLLYNLSAQAAVPFTPVFQEDNNRLLLVTEPLNASNFYIVVVTSGVKGVDGTGVIADQIYTFAKSRTPLIDEQGYSLYAALSDANANALEPLRAGLSTLFKLLEDGLDIPRSDIALAWPFSTQTVFGALNQLSQAANAMGLPAVTHHATIEAAEHPLLQAAEIPRDNLCHVHTGTMTLPRFVTDAGTLNPEGPSSTSVGYTFITPNEGDCEAPWESNKVVIFAHALGRCKNDALALADTLAAHGFATLSLDGPRAGGRTVGNLGDQDLDGCADQPDVPELLGLGGDVNPFVVRDQLRQWGIELAQAARVAKQSPWLFFSGEAPADPEAADVALFGHSWGGIAASLAAAVSNQIDALAVNAASANMTSVFADSLRAALTAQLEAASVDTSSEAGAAMLAARTAETLTTFQWILDPADPRHLVGRWRSTMSALVQVVDPGTGTDVALHPVTGQSTLATLAHANSVEATTYTMTYDPGDGSAEPICDPDTPALVSILQPCAAEGARAAQAFAKLEEMRSQLVYFLLTQTVCGGDGPACP